MALQREVFAALKAEFQARSAAASRVAREELVPTEVSGLDDVLGGGFPAGSLVSLEGHAGRWSIAARLIAQVTRRSMAAVIDDGALYPPSLARAGARLDRVLVVPARTPLGVARAADILLRSRACKLVLLSAPALRASVWNRLAGLAHRCGVLLIAIAERAGAPLAAAARLRLNCVRDRLVIHGLRGVWCTIAGYDVRAEVAKYTRAMAGAHARIRACERFAGATLRERAVKRWERRANVAMS